MTNTSEKRALLPAGLQDLLPPLAQREAQVVEALIASFRQRGYQRVKPPLLEFEESLSAGAGEAVAGATFRLMDPVSQRMLGLRADMTPQVARIAATRLKKSPRPLRLCYAGQVLQVKGGQLRPERQFGQVGAELIGADAAVADAEVAILAAEALLGVGVQDITLDLNLPTLVPVLGAAWGLDATTLKKLRPALDRKDAAAVTRLAGKTAKAFLDLLRMAGPAQQTVKALRKLKGAKMLTGELDRLDAVIATIAAALPEVALSFDPVEHRGFEYQTGISFILFARGVRGELGRGGRYQSGEGEAATGFTLFMDSVLRAVKPGEKEHRLFLPHGCDAKTGEHLRGQGWITVQGLAPTRDSAKEAKRLGCTHFLLKNKPQKV